MASRSVGAPAAAPDGAAGLDAILKPRTIAVVGASRSPDAIGHQILSNLVRHGFTGAVYPINPKADSIHSIRAYARIDDVPDEVDLAVIAVPAERVVAVAKECAAAGVRGLVVISAGFREIGREGAEREQELVEVVRQHGMRLVGPNCLGVLNANDQVSMNATFAPVMPAPGRVAFLSQSGALGLSILDYASEYRVGVSQFVSVGNKPDVSGNDLLEYWEDDDSIGVILMYVESFGNPRKFREIASRVSRKKPIIALKAGRSKAGAGAALSHTGALAADDIAVDALLAQAGVLRAASIEELFDMAMAMGVQPLPRSPRTAVVTNSGGPGILAADALEMNGLELAQLAPETVERLRPLFPEEASLRNPVDLIATARPSTYRGALETVLCDDGVDAAIAIFVPPLGVRQEDVAEAIVAAARTCRTKPVLAVLMGREGLPQGRAALEELEIPAYTFPESAARALAARSRSREWLERPVSEVVPLPVDRDRAAALLEGAQREGRQRLTELESLELLAAYGIPVTPSRLARDAEEAVRFAAECGFPVVLKVSSPAIVHKTDVGGVALGISNVQDARTAYERLIEVAARAAPDAEVYGVLVQKQLAGGRETIAGISRDPLFGPLVMFGLGGIFVEVLRDVVFRLAPIDEREAAGMVNGLRGARLLTGVRGQKPCDAAALEEVLRRLSQLAVDFPAIAAVDVNPLLAFEDGAVAVDARVVLGGEVVGEEAEGGPLRRLARRGGRGGPRGAGAR